MAENKDLPKNYNQEKEIKMVDVVLLRYNRENITRQRKRWMTRKLNLKRLFAEPIIGTIPAEKDKVNVIDGRIRVEAAIAKGIEEMPIIIVTHEEAKYIRNNGLTYDLIVKVPKKIKRLKLKS